MHSWGGCLHHVLRVAGTGSARTVMVLHYLVSRVKSAAFFSFWCMVSAPFFVCVEGGASSTRKVPVPFSRDVVDRSRAYDD